MRYLLKTVLFTLLLATFAACNKDDDEPQLPPATQTGQNTFGCLVNGEVWVAKGKFPINSISPFYNGDAFSLQANRVIPSENIDESIGINVTQGLNSIGTYILNDSNDGHALYNDIKDSCPLETDASNTGELTITHLDTDKRIIAGRFAFCITDPTCGTVNITNGRFDIRY